MCAGTGWARASSGWAWASTSKFWNLPVLRILNLLSPMLWRIGCPKCKIPDVLIFNISKQISQILWRIYEGKWDPSKTGFCGLSAGLRMGPGMESSMEPASDSHISFRSSLRIFSIRVSPFCFVLKRSTIPLQNSTSLFSPLCASFLFVSLRVAPFASLWKEAPFPCNISLLFSLCFVLLFMYVLMFCVVLNRSPIPVQNIISLFCPSSKSVLPVSFVLLRFSPFSPLCFRSEKKTL